MVGLNHPGINITYLSLLKNNVKKVRTFGIFSLRPRWYNTFWDTAIPGILAGHMWIKGYR